MLLGNYKNKIGSTKGDLGFMITMAFGKVKGSYTRKPVDAKRAWI